MARPKRPVEEKKCYKYEITDVEAAYQIFMNPDKEKFDKIKESINANDGFCPCRLEHIPENRCMCKQFRERDSEGWCKCRAYFKKARTAKQAQAYKSQEFAANEKKEKAAMKEMDKESKEAQKREDE
jgi:hypothetical protein